MDRLDSPPLATDRTIRVRRVGHLLEAHVERIVEQKRAFEEFALPQEVFDRLRGLDTPDGAGKNPQNAGLRTSPANPYTETLVSAIPRVDTAGSGGPADRIVPSGDVPSPVNPPSGCVFHPRCHRADADCERAHPDLQVLDDGDRTSRCLYAEEVFRAENEDPRAQPDD